MTPPARESTSLDPSPHNPALVVEEETQRRKSYSPRRPKITRYKSLPGRNEGLGLEIIVKPTEKPSGSSTISPNDTRRVSAGSANSRRGSNNRQGTRKRLSGSWASVDVVDALPISDLGIDSSSTSTSPFSSARQSISTGAGTSPENSSGIASSLSLSDPVFLVEEIHSRAHLAEFGSMKSAEKGINETTPLIALDHPTEYVLALKKSGWNATFPRRGSLAVLNKTALAPWAVTAELGGLGIGDKDRVEGIGKHWSDRRGSWAEGWGKM